MFSPFTVQFGVVQARRLASTITALYVPVAGLAAEFMQAASAPAAPPIFPVTISGVRTKIRGFTAVPIAGAESLALVFSVEPGEFSEHERAKNVVSKQAVIAVKLTVIKFVHMLNVRKFRQFGATIFWHNSWRHRVHIFMTQKFGISLRHLAYLLAIPVALSCVAEQTEPRAYSQSQAFESSTDIAPAVNEEILSQGMNGSFASHSALELRWARVFPDGNSGWISNETVAAAGTNNGSTTYITGSYWGKLSFDSLTAHESLLPQNPARLPPPSDIFVTKLDATGKVLWSRSFGNVESQWTTAIVTDSDDNAYIAGGFYGNIQIGNQMLIGPEATQQPHAFVAKLRSLDGQLEWAMSLGNRAPRPGSQIVTQLLRSADDDLLLVGAFTGTIAMGRDYYAKSAGSKDIFVLSLSNQGNYRWFRTFGGSSNDVPVSAGLGPDGQIVIAGNFGKSLTFATPAGSPANVLRDSGGGDMFLVRLDKGGEHVWSRSFGDNRRQELHSLSVSGTGRIAIAGAFAGVLNFGIGNMESHQDFFTFDSGRLFTAVFDAQGNAKWQQSLGESGNYQKLYSISFMPAGELLLSGGSNAPITCGLSSLAQKMLPGQLTRFFLKYSRDGNCQSLETPFGLTPFPMAESDIHAIRLKSHGSGPVLVFGGLKGNARGLLSTAEAQGKDADAIIGLLR